MQLAVRSYGERGKRLLLLHGLGSNADGWWRVGPALAEAGFHVTAPDLRGHGSSEHVDDYSLAAYAQDVFELGHWWDVVVGHSLGGAVALRLFDRKPDFADRLILLDPAIILPDADVAIEALIAPYDAPLTPGRVSADNPTWHAEDARIKAEALQQSSPTVTLMTVRHNSEWNLVKAATELTVPTLIVGADESLGALVPPALGHGIGELNDNVTFVSVPGSSHSIHRDEFEPLMSHVLTFLA